MNYWNKIIHLGDAGKASTACGLRSKKINWQWKPEGVTCKRCISVYKLKVERNKS